MKVASIVEGDGEVVSLPLLLRRIGSWRSPARYADIGVPIRVRRDRFIQRDDEFRRYVQLASSKAGPDGWILILLDADDDCPAQLGATLLARARECTARENISVVLVKREFEAWFIAAADSLNGCRGFKFDPSTKVEAEEPRDAKGWVKERMPGRSYGSTTDQPAFCAQMNLQQAHVGSRSFRKLCSEWDRYFLPAGVQAD